MATTKQLVRSALLGAFVFAGKWVLSGLPNIHPVALLVLIYTVCLGARSALAATAVYVMLEGLFYGLDVYKRQARNKMRRDIQRPGLQACMNS